jgi:MFS superfamily sulfate permease-like transporter
MGDVDYSGADTIRQVKEELARSSVTFAICDLSPKVRGQLDAYGLTELIGTDRIFATATDVIAAYRASADAAAPASPPAADPAPAQG